MTVLDSPPETSLDVRDPATGEVVGCISAGSPEAADRAVRAARAAQPAWARRPAAERGALLKAAAGRLREHARELAELQTREGGQPIGGSLGGAEAGGRALRQAPRPRRPPPAAARARGPGPA